MTRGLAVVVVSVVLCGCTDELTQIVVSVHTDIDGVSAVAVEVDATRAGGELRRFEEPVGSAGSIALPATLAIVSRGGSDRPIRVVATALRGSTVLLSRTAEVRFVPGESRTLSLDLLSCCVGVTCSDSQSCGESGCVDIDVGGRSLPAWTGAAPPSARCSAMDAGSGEGGIDGGTDSGFADAGEDTGHPDACDLRRPPARPVGPDDGTGGIRWYAVRSLDSGEGTRWAEIAWDLDGLCTDIDSSELACEPQPGFGPPADGRGGVDNAFGQSLVGLFALFEPTFFTRANAEVEDGRVGFLLRVAGWNGLPDDPQVDLAFVDAVEGLRRGETLGDGGMVAGDASITLPDGGSATRPLAWDGTDRWYADTASFAGGNPEQPINRDRSAYVSGGLLVGSAGNGARFVISAVNRSLPILLGTDTIITGRLSPDGARIEGGIVAGSWGVDAILDSFVQGVGICGVDCRCTGPAYTNLVRTLERVSDLPLDPDTGITVRCDAVSIGLGFEATAAELGGLGTAAPLLVCGDTDAGMGGADGSN